MKRTGELQRKAPMARKPLKAKRKRKTSTADRWRSEEYLAWVRSLPCSLCGMAPSDAHHVIGLGWGLSGMGLTAPCSFAMPLCRFHHTQVHQHPDIQRAQPQWLKWTLTKGIRQFDGEARAELVRALEFIEAREEAA